MTIVNLGEVGRDKADPQHVIIVEKPESSTDAVRWTRADFDAACNAVARGLQRAGVGVHDRIGLLAPNSARYLTVIFGAMRIGAVPVPINTKLGVDTIEHILADAKVRVLFSDDVPGDLAGRVDHVVPLAGDGFESFCDPGPLEAIEPAEDVPALQLYTSGSTGVPKGVALNHAAKLWAVAAYTPPIPGEFVRPVVAGPLYHKNAFLVSMVGLAAGGTIALLPRFKAADYLQAVANQRMTMLSGVPTMFAMLLEETELIRTLDLSSVRMILIGSAPLTDALLARVQETFPNAAITNNYGTTEAAAIFGPHPEGKPRPSNSLGALLPGSEARLVDGPSEDEGVLQIRNPSVMMGYHNMPEATAAKLRDGWYDTGDVLRRDEDGFFYFVGRSDDMFVCGGENVYPGEVESLLERHPAVQAAGVVSVPDERKGAVPFAFVVLQEGASAGEQELKDFTIANGPAYAHPRHVVFVDELPLSGTNKIDKKELSARAEAALR